MKQLTSYFSSKTSSSSSAGGAAPVIDTSDAASKGGEENKNDLPKSTVKKKRPLNVGEADSTDDDNLKKRKVNGNDGDTNSNDGELNLEHSNAANNSDADEKADVTQHPDTPNQPIGSNDE
eukprot:scaffold9934_cov39-Skeletonema_dohrnii-CCMP3373.AAC.1